MFLVVLFLLKTGFFFKDSVDSSQNKQGEGLVYGTALVQDLVNKDGDGDGVLDWEESLWGTDPMKKETTPGTPDGVAISKLKTEQRTNEGEEPSSGEGTEKLTETDKFSRELFSTVAALNQNGAMDEATAEKITNSLAERIQNSSPEKIYTISDIKITPKDNIETVKNYDKTLNNTKEENPVNYTVFDVLQKFIIDEDNVDVSALSELNPIIEQLGRTINIMLGISVPQSLSTQHLNVINGLEKVMENISNIKLYETDVILSLSAISQYEQNATTLESSIIDLGDVIQKKLNN